MIDPGLIKEFYNLIDTYREKHEANSLKGQALLTMHPELAHISFGDYDIPEPLRPDPLTPLHIAARHLDINLIRQLLALGADVNSQPSDWPNTPLMFAVTAGLGNTEEYKQRKLQTIELLLEAGADPNLADDDGETAFHKAKIAYYSMYADVVKLLLRYGADPNRKNKGGFTAMSDRQCSVEALKWMIEAGAAVNASRPDGVTPLMFAIRDCEDEEMSILLAHGADIHARDKQRATVLHYAAHNTVGTKAVDLLLKAGAKPNLKAGDGCTPLHDAAGSGDPQSVRLLLAAGADVHARNHKKKTPLDLAEEEKALAASRNDAPRLARAEEKIALLKQAAGVR